MISLNVAGDQQIDHDEAHRPPDRRARDMSSMVDVSMYVTCAPHVGTLCRYVDMDPEYSIGKLVCTRGTSYTYHVVVGTVVWTCPSNVTSMLAVIYVDL
jgi:hypothetical protein